jgi:hypothetical protein
MGGLAPNAMYGGHVTGRPDAGPAVASTTTARATPRTSGLRAAYRDELGPRERSALLSWIAFTATFAGVRAITYSIKHGEGPFHDVTVGGAHLHHYMWGIAMVSGVGAVAVSGDERIRDQPLVGLTYGSGLALIVDEFALLLDLKDVYWAKQGRTSVDLGIGIVALGGIVLQATPILRRLARDRQRRVIGHR